jgi:hypothetical protein
MAAHDDLKKALFLPFIAGALGTAGRVVGSYIASRGAASAARRGVGVAARAVRSGIATAARSTRQKGVMQTLGDLGRSNTVQAVGFGSTAYGVYDTYKTGQESAAYRADLQSQRAQLRAPRPPAQRMSRANRALSEAAADADNDGVPNERELPEDQRNFRRGNARTS